MDDLHFYLHSRYGTCALEQCVCRQQKRPPGWPCVHWKATGARTWDELREKMRERHAPEMDRVD